MNTLKKKAQVIMLTTTDSRLMIGSNGTLVLFSSPKQSTTNVKAQHLYFIINERPKEKEWFITLDGTNSLKQCTSIDEQYINFKEGFCTRPSVCWKVIASTDESLKIEKCSEFIGKEYNYPQPSESFIQKYISEYNKGSVIKEVMIDFYPHKECYMPKEWNTPKVDKNNCITITRCKDNITKQELRFLITKLKSLPKEEQLMIMDSVESFDNWIEQNLS